MPVTMAIWFSETSRPRIADGESFCNVERRQQRGDADGDAPGTARHELREIAGRAAPIEEIANSIFGYFGGQEVRSEAAYRRPLTSTRSTHVDQKHILTQYLPLFQPCHSKFSSTAAHLQFSNSLIVLQSPLVTNYSSPPIFSISFPGRVKSDIVLVGGNIPETERMEIVKRFDGSKTAVALLPPAALRDWGRDKVVQGIFNVLNESVKDKIPPGEQG